MFENQTIDMADRYSYIMLVFFFCLLYTTMTPLVPIICFLGQIYSYWVDKVTSSPTFIVSNPQTIPQTRNPLPRNSSLHGQPPPLCSPRLLPLPTLLLLDSLLRPPRTGCLYPSYRDTVLSDSPYQKLS